MKSQQALEFKGDFINGNFVTTDRYDGEFKDVSPGDLNDTVLNVSYRYDHVEEACAAAKKAYMPWAKLSMGDRIQYLERLKKVFIDHSEQMAEVISRDTGKPLWETRTEAKALVGKIDITLTQSVEMIAEQRFENALPGVDGVVRFRSRGVMAVIGPFNFPAHLPNGHIIPALLAGNTIVFKPSEHTAATGQFMAELYEKAEFPPGVFNLVQGDGETGRKLSLSEQVDGILFTGSYEVGLKIKMETARHYWKIIALEMGGKNATVVWEDADLDKAIYETLIGAYLTSGQRCSCTSRILLHEKIADEFTDRFYKAAKKLKIGHWSEDNFMGPLISSGAVEKYLRFQEIAKREGCESLMRGKVLELPYKGHYVTPSIHLVKAYNAESIYQKSEIFGPNVAILKVDDFGKSLDIINSSGYGLVMALFTKNPELYQEALLRARVGLLNWNRTTNGASSKLPFGGIDKSGNDRPSGSFAIQYCTVPLASLEDHTGFDPSKVMPGMNY